MPSLEWKEDAWGRTAIVAGWLALSVSRISASYYAAVGSMPIKGGNGCATTFATVAAACQAAEARAKQMLDLALAELAAAAAAQGGDDA